MQVRGKVQGGVEVQVRLQVRVEVADLLQLLCGEEPRPLASSRNGLQAVAQLLTSLAIHPGLGVLGTGTTTT